MDIKETKKEYLPVRLLDSDEKGTIEIVKADGRNYVLRTMNGKIGSYIALKNISSPYLPKIESAEYKDGKTIVVEEYIEGEKNISSLTDEKAVVSAFCELCDVLTLLHSRGIIHRDIKPSNILIAPDGHIRLIDFDASRYYDDSKENDTCYLGTRGYAPPEQFGYSQTNATADIYSLGVTLRNVLDDKADKRKYSRIIRKCTEFDPKNRYPSAAAVKKALLSGNLAVILPILLLLAVVAGLIFCFMMYSPAAEHNDSEIDTLPSETVTVSSETPSETKLTSLAALKTSSVTSSKTTVPTTEEETTAVPETELTSETEDPTVTAETTVSETSEPQEASASSSVTTSAPAASHTSKTTKTTKRTEKTTSAATTTVKETEPAATTAATSSSAPAGTMLMVCTTDKLRTPISSVVRINGRNFDELAEPWTFSLDEAVIGEWKYLTSTGQGAEIYDKMYYKKIVSDPKNATYPQSLYFYTDGICKFKTVYPSSGAIYSDPLEWTYGLIATPAVQEYYFYEHYYIYSADDGKEYLFVERKNGDYMNADSPSEGLHYMIYERSTEE